MKKNIFKLFSAMVVSATVLTGCIEEGFSRRFYCDLRANRCVSYGTWGCSQWHAVTMVQGYLVYGSQTHETDLGYPSLMLAQSELLGDVVDTDYGMTGGGPSMQACRCMTMVITHICLTLLYISLLNRPMTWFQLLTLPIPRLPMRYVDSAVYPMLSVRLAIIRWWCFSSQ